MNRIFKLLLLCGAMPVFPAAAQDTAQDQHTRIAALLQEGDWEKVLGCVKSMSAPDNYALQSAGFAAYQSADKIAASDYFEQLLSRDSCNRQALYYEAVILKGDDQSGAAIPLLERLCRVAPSVASYHVLLADCYTVTDQKTAAVFQLREANTLFPNSPGISNKLVSALMRVKHYDSAENLLRETMEQHPRDPALITTGISLSYARKQYRRASALCDSLIGTGRMKYDALLMGLYADISQPDFEHAIKIGAVLTALGNETEDVLYYTAIAHQHLGHWETADTLLRKCVSKLIKPNLKGYYVALADGAEHQKHFAQSKSWYDTAYYLFQDPVMLYQSGRMLELAGRKNEAAVHYKRYLSLPPKKQDTIVARYIRHQLSQ